MPKGVYPHKPTSEETKQKLREARKRQVIIHSEETKKKISDSNKGKQAGALHPNYKHGLCWTKKYISLFNRKNNALNRFKGELSTATIQMVYEDNIKKFGKLTCYLCELPIEFGQDSLEHNIPLSRGGTHIYENLGVSHNSCNSKKRDKTAEEYLNVS